ncbi:MAG: ABC transporter ATP-binding protein [Peptococcaceae bacterium]|jgi:putative ABC transport system ATP-binding protein|nr:ABC transporter ATP-binding protein [Peptococcaceae bacterium]
MYIEAKELSKIYGQGEGQVVALDKASLQIAEGDFISIIGPSGSGKSTLLHLLSGLDRPSAGSLTYDGQEIYQLKDRELAAFRRRRIGFIFQQFNLLPVLTAQENILLPLLLDKKRPDEAWLRQLTGLLGLSERLQHLPHELSGGQQQRVAIARALIAQPEVVFADEPTGNLDSKSGGEVMTMLLDIWRRLGKSLVVITHDSRIAQMAPRRLEIVDGKLTEVGR